MNQDCGANLLLLAPFSQLTEFLRQLRSGSKERCSLGRIMPYMHDIATRISVPLQDISDNGARRLDVRDGEKAVVIFILLLGDSRFSNPRTSRPRSSQRRPEKENLPRRQSQERCPLAWVWRAQRQGMSGKTFLIALSLLKIERLRFYILC